MAWSEKTPLSQTWAEKAPSDTQYSHAHPAHATLWDMGDTKWDLDVNGKQQTVWDVISSAWTRIS